MRRSLFSHTPDSDLEMSTSPNQHLLNQPTDRLTDRPPYRQAAWRERGGEGSETKRRGGEEKVKVGEGREDMGKEGNGGKEIEGDLI